MYHIVIINTDGAFELKSQDDCPELKQLKDAVGGWIETVPYWEDYGGRRAVVFCNEEGKLDGLPVNEVATAIWHDKLKPNLIDDFLCGNIIVVSCDTADELAEL
jgi:hypothetical protein